MKNLIFLLLVLGLAGSTWAVDRNWTNGNGNRLWTTAANWSGSVVPTSADKAAIRDQTKSGPIIQTGMNAVASQIVVGDWSSTNDTLDITGGTLTTGSWVIFAYGAANRGTFTISAGTVSIGDTLYIGYSGTGTLNMTGGTITVTNAFGVAQLAGSTGTANLNGGSISCGSFNMTSGGHIDITMGTLIINGDVTAAVNAYVTGNQITAYGDTGTVNVSYNSPNPGKTTVTASAPAGNTKDWTNGAGTRYWRTGTNWSGGTVPGSGDKAAIRNDLISGPIIDTGTAAVCNEMVIGDWSSTRDTLDITGGTLTTNSWVILGYAAGNNGIFTITGGTATIANNLFVGNSGAGTLDISGGTLTVNGTLGVAQLTGSTGTIYLDGGTVNCAAFNMATGSLMDVTAGTMIIDGDYTTTISTYRGNGWITAYGGSGSLSVTYNSPNIGKTTINATMPTQPPTKATNPNPASGAQNQSIQPTLTWNAGNYASTHDVYFGTSNPPAFRQNQSGTSFSPGVLTNNILYYWRIDEKNAQGTTTGDLWSFRTVNDTSYSLIGKIMCGYQGWFDCPGDGTSRGWIHWSTSTGSFTTSTCKVDLWPDVTELASSEKFLASSWNDGTDHYVFSSHNRDTVMRHFRWMQDYGIDGVYIQRFVTECTPGSAPFNMRNDVLSYCKDGANTYGRKYAIMYDLGGLNAGETTKCSNDWKWLMDNGRVSKNPAYDPAYIFYKGKPVVAVYGVAFPSGRNYSHLEVKNLINFFKNDPTYGGCTVLIGVHSGWRTYSDTNVQATLQLADIIMPWWVNAYHDRSTINNYATSKGVPDKSWCVSNGKDYLPVMWPGFSWHNMYDADPLNEVPRAGGQFFWDQVYADIHTIGATMLYIAMFDEVDEGTAIFKYTNSPPMPGGVDYFVTPDFDGYALPSDEYLWLAGQASAGLRNEIPVNQTRPTRTGGQTTKDWTNGSGTRAWGTAGNWSGGVPTTSDKAAIRNAAVSGPQIGSGTNAVANQIVVGDLSSTRDTLDMTGGTLTTSGANCWMILGYNAGNNGIFTISAGTVNIGDNLFVGNGGSATLTQTGGTITVIGTLGIAQVSGSSTANLNGGSISCGSFNMTSGGHADITTGTLIIDGDVTAAITAYKNNNQITAYGGTGTVNISYNTPNAGKTTVTGTSGGGGGTPTFVAAGAVSSGTGTITPALPAGLANGDILLLFVETANQAVSITNQNGGTWTQVTSSPQGTGTAGGTAATCLTAFWSRYNGTQGAPTVSDSGNHQLARIIAIRGAAASGNPWNITAGGVESTADTSGSIPGATTTVANCLVVTAIATSLPDSSSTTRFSAWTNANLTSVTERTDNSVTAGNGGGLGIATGIKATAGAYGNTAVTLATSASKGMMSIAIKP